MMTRKLLQHVQRTVVPAVLGLAALLSAHAHALAATQTYTEVRINSLSSVLDAAPDSARDETGADIQVGIAGSRAAGFSASGGAVVKQVTDDVLARAALQTGTLKA